MQVIKTLLEHGSDPLQSNEKGLTPVDVCKDPAILKILRENSNVEEVEGEQGDEGQVKTGSNETIKGDDREEEVDEDVFEAKVETSQDTSAAPKRLRGKLGQHERDTASQSSEEGVLTSKMASVRKQLKDDFSSEVATRKSDEAQSFSTVAEGGRNSTSGGDGSLTKLVGKAVPFFSDISSSESESELPEVKLTNLEKTEDSLPPSAFESVEEVGEQERQREQENKKKRQASPVEVREEGEEEEKLPSTKEETKVKILEDQGMAASGECIV